MQRTVVRTGCLLKEMRGDTSRIAAAMLLLGDVFLSAAIGSHIVLHAYQPVVVMVMGNDRYHQHDHADEHKEICDIPFSLHSALFVGAKIVVNGLTTKYKLLKSLEQCV